jgi:hypothetical protein
MSCRLGGDEVGDEGWDHRGTEGDQSGTCVPPLWIKPITLQRSTRLRARLLTATSAATIDHRRHALSESGSELGQSVFLALADNRWIERRLEERPTDVKVFTGPPWSCDLIWLLVMYAATGGSKPPGQKTSEQVSWRQDAIG